jgi:hypothetical protein
MRKRWEWSAAVLHGELTTVLTTTLTTVAVPATPPTRPFAVDLACLLRLPAPGSVGLKEARRPESPAAGRPASQLIWEQIWEQNTVKPPRIGAM